MSDNPKVSCEIPPDWKGNIERLALLRKKLPEEIIYEAIAQYLGEDVQGFDTRIKTLELEVSSLHGMVASLSSTVKNLQERLVTTAFVSFSDSHSVKAQRAVQNVSLPSYEDIEDEPDEILYDFLDPQ